MSTRENIKKDFVSDITTVAKRMCVSQSHSLLKFPTDFTRFILAQLYFDSLKDKTSVTRLAVSEYSLRRMGL